MSREALAAAQIQIRHGDAEDPVAQYILWRRRQSSSVCVRGDAALRVLFGDWIVMRLKALLAAHIQFRPGDTERANFRADVHSIAAEQHRSHR